MTSSSRATENPVLPILLDRWSPRAFDGSEIAEADLMTLFDAARWAPSAYNAQPWRFLYARRDSADWQRFLDILVPFNASWAKDASALVIIASDTMTQMGASEPRPSHSHSFDAGAAWMAIALQARAQGLYTHAMSGIDLDRARTELQIPERYRVEAAFVVGRIGDKSQLPEALQEREAPSGRNPIENIAFAGNFPAQ
jgi:nitroreductase